VKLLLERLAQDHQTKLKDRLSGEEMLRRHIRALFSVLSDIYGPDKLVLKAGRLGALQGMRAEAPGPQILALQRIVYEDPTLDRVPAAGEMEEVLTEIEEQLADVIARRSVEDKIERKIAERMQERHDEYVKELRTQILKEDAGPENAQTLKRYARLELMDRTRLTRSVIERLRPGSMAEVLGQERAVSAVLAKLASPYPQHIILYGPPGVGKTTVARLALETAKALSYTPFNRKAPFIEVGGATLRWDPREATNPLIGSVHDPIYQGARRDLADSGVPEPKLGLVSEAHGGVLFIDEIGELDPLLQNKLLKVLEDKRVTFDSAYYDPSDPQVPKYVKRLFEQGAPADFVLIGATTRDPSQISPALRSRAAEVFFDPLSPDDIRAIVAGAAGKLGVNITAEAVDLITDYTAEGRKAVGLLADAYGLALYRWSEQETHRREVRRREGEGKAAQAGKPRRKGRSSKLPSAGEITIDCALLNEAIRSGRMTPNQPVMAGERAEVGRVFAVGVSGYIGSAMEIEAVVFPARQPDKGTVRFNETAGTMARDSVFNATSVIRRLTGEDLKQYDVHVNVVGGGCIDGPSAGLAIVLAILSALQDRPLRQDVAVTGEVSLQGRIKPVGGIHEKVHGARRAGMKRLLLPADNGRDIVSGDGLPELVPVATVAEAMSHVFAD